MLLVTDVDGGTEIFEGLLRQAIKNLRFRWIWLWNNGPMQEGLNDKE